MQMFFSLLAWSRIKRDDLICWKHYSGPNQTRFYHLYIRHNSSNFVPTFNLICIKIVSVLNSQSCDLKHGNTSSNHCEVIILLMKSLAGLKDQVKNIVYKIFLNEIDFHTLFDTIILSIPSWHLSIKFTR